MYDPAKLPPLPVLDDRGVANCPEQHHPAPSPADVIDTFVETTSAEATTVGDDDLALTLQSLLGGDELLPGESPRVEAIRRRRDSMDAGFAVPLSKRSRVEATPMPAPPTAKRSSSSFDLEAADLELLLGDARPDINGPRVTPRLPSLPKAGGDEGSETEAEMQLAERLADFDNDLKDHLREGVMRLISCEWLLQQPLDWRLPRMQVLRDEHPNALLPPSTAAALLERRDRSIFAVSHGWLSRGDPDPHGARLPVLRSYLEQLRTAGQLPADAALFWDFGSLPQKPRTTAEDRDFQRALRIMADVYASPLGTAVLQIKDIPMRPKALDGCIAVCQLDANTPDQAIEDYLSTFGRVCNYAHDECEPDASARYERHASARAAADSDHRPLGESSFVCLAYNERPYHERGWCVAEEMFSTECLLRLKLPPLARPKVLSLRAGGTAVEVRPKVSDLSQRSSEVQAAILRTTFTGKGDREKVLQIHIAYQRRLGNAALVPKVV